jgi:hypothetical protein
VSDLKPTDEQQAVIDNANDGETFVVDAVAGSGKTSTLRMAAEAMSDRRILYLVYNRAASDDAKKSFPKNVDVKTTSALAYKDYVGDYGHRLIGAPYVPARQTAKLLGINEPIQLGEHFVYWPQQIARLAVDTVDNFARSADFEVLEKHVSMKDMLLGLNESQIAALKQAGKYWGQKLWTQTIVPASQHRFTFDYAFKLYAMSGPDLSQYGAIFIDEAQDSNDIVEAFVKNQWTQKVIVGDPAQQLYCQPLRTMVEVVTKENSGSTRAESASVPIENLKVGDKVVTYDNTHLWRNGRAITHITRFHHEGELVRVTTTSGATSAYTPKHHCIIRIDDNLADKHVVYLMRRGSQYRIGRTQMMYSSQHKGFGIVLRGRKEKADGLWILSMHDSVGDASLAEMLTQHEYNIPGVHFEPTDHDAADIAKFWQKLGDNSKNGERCLSAFGRLPEFPLWSPEMTQKMGIRTSIPTAAANVMDGMTVLPLRNADDRSLKGKAPRWVWEPVTVSREYYADDVISLEVDEHHNYFGDGILTHNSWRGAVDIMGRFDGPRLPLSQSWRFGEQIAEEANKWLEHTGTKIKVKGNPYMDSLVLDSVAGHPDAVLCRTNASAIDRAVHYLDNDLSVAIVGGTDKLMKLAMAASELYNGKETTHPELVAFKTWQELADFSEEPSGSELKALVNLIRIHGPSGIKQICYRVIPESKQEAKKLRQTFQGDPDVIISTAHKAKGREWGSVQIGEDFEPPPPVLDPLTGEPGPGPIKKADAMLHYVAVTRGRQVVHRGSLAYIDDYEGVPRDVFSLEK